MGQETLGGQIGPVEVATGEVAAADVDLPQAARRDRLEVRVEQHDLGAGDGEAERHRRPGRQRPAAAAPGEHRDCGLGRAVAVEQHGIEHRADAAGEIGWHRFGAGHHRRQAAAVGEVRLLEHGREVRSGEGDVGHRLVPDQAGQVAGVAGAARPGQHHRAAGHQRGEDLTDRGVEADGGLVKEPDRPPPLFAERMHPPGKGTVRHRHPLGAAGRPRGIDHVGGGERRHRGQGGAAGALLVPRRIVDRQHLEATALQAVQDARQPGLGEHRRRAGVGEQVGQPFGRQLGVQGEVGGTGPQHGEQARDGLARALLEDRHPILRADSQAQQAVRQPPGELIERAVGPDGAGQAESHPIGAPLGMGGDPLVDQRKADLLDCGMDGGSREAVPFVQELVALGGGEQRQGGEPRRRIRRGGGEQPLELAGQADHGRAIEEVGAEHPPEGEAAVLPAARGEGQIELGGGDRHLERRRFEPAREPPRGPKQPEAGDRCRLHGEHDLKDRGDRRVALRADRLDQLLERQVLVCPGAEGGLAGPRQQLAGGGIARQIDAQDHRVDQQPDQRLELQPVAAGDRRAHHQIALPGKA
jgi:hypothetical protein